MEVPEDKKPKVSACFGTATYKPKDFGQLTERYNRRYKKELIIDDENLSKYADKVSERLHRLSDRRMLIIKNEMKKQGIIPDRNAHETLLYSK